MPTTHVNNLDMYYESKGKDQNPPIVLLHAFPLDHNVWTPQAKEFSKDYWVITPDFRGHGFSRAPSGTYTMDLLARDVKALLEKLRVRKFVMGGISLGGYVAFAYQRLFPDDIKALILVDTKADADTPQAKTGRKELADLVLTKGVSSFADRMLPRLFSKQNLDGNAAIVKEARKTIETMNPSGIVGTLQGMAERPDSTPLLDQIHVPTLIIVGENDPTTTVDDSKKVAGRITGSKLVIVPNAGHISTLEQPEKVTSAMRVFLQEIQLQRKTSTA
jgi:3-oxoadipate enol-lactonase